MKNFDIVGFQELFGTFSWRRERFIAACTSAGYTHYVIAPRPSKRFLIDGGLAILSKFPIVECHWDPFKPGVHSDRLAEKGTLHAKIEINASKNIYVHVFNAHTQSSYHDPVGSASWKVRERQTLQMLDFIQECTKDDLHPVVIMGDLNIDARKEMPNKSSSTEYLGFMQQLSEMKSSRSAEDKPQPFKVSDLLYDFNDGNHPVTFGDAHDIDGVKVPLETILTKAHDFASLQRLDYLFWATRPDLPQTDSSHQKNIQHAKQRTGKKQHDKDDQPNSGLVPIESKVARFFVAGFPFTQLSDHYGVEATFEIIE